MRLKLALSTALASVVSLAAAGTAAATTFCVPTFHPACPDNGTNVEQANIEAAMGMNAFDGTPDTVIAAAGTYVDPQSFEPSGMDPLTVRGAGPDATVLTSSSTSNIFVVNLTAGGNPRAITLEDLTIEIPASFPDAGGNGAGAQIGGDTLDNVDIVSRNTGGSDAIASVIGTGTFKDGEIRGESGGHVTTGVRLNNNSGSMTVEDSVLSTTVAGIELDTDSNAAPTGPLNARRVTFVGPSQGAVSVEGGTANLENSLILLDDVGHALYVRSDTAIDATLNADHVTAVAPDVNAHAVFLHVPAGVAGDTTLNLTNSILRGFVGAFNRQAPTRAGTGDANVTFSYSNFTEGTPLDVGDGTGDLTVANIDADPLFVSPSNYALKPGSPSIDAGSPAPAPTVDIVGAPRPRDGDSTPGAVRDQGAYEYQPVVVPPPVDETAPQTTIVKRPKKKVRKRAATFSFTSSEAGSTFRCRLDSKPERDCTSPANYKRLKRGKHTFRVYATDQAGNADATPATYSFKVKPKKRKRK